MALSDNLVAYWKLDEASGTRVDATGRGNDLTDNNTVTQNPGIVGQASQFTRANTEYLSRADNTDLRGGNVAFTISAWVYRDTRPLSGIVTKGGGSTREYDLRMNASGLIEWQVGTGAGAWAGQIASGPAITNPGQWYFVVAYLDTTGGLVGVSVNNAAPVTSALAGTPGTTSQAFNIGAIQNANNWDGRIDEVGIWKRLLTAAERTALYNGGAGHAYPFVDALTASALATGAAVFGSPVLGQKHSLSGVALSTGATVFGAPPISQKHSLTATALSTGAANVAAPAISQKHTLSAASQASGAAILGVPAFGQAHALIVLAPNTGAAQFGAPAITHVLILSASGLITGAALFGLPVLGQSYPLVALGLTTSPAILGGPALFVPPFTPAPAVRVVRVPANSRVTKVING